MMRERGGERVSRADRIHNANGESGVLVDSILANENASAAASRHADKPQAVRLQESPRRDFFALIFRELKKFCHPRQFFVVELQDLSKLEGLRENFRGVKRLAKVYVENAHGPGARAAQKSADCLA
jgi:hypothetical protein